MMSLSQYDKTVLLLPMNGANNGTTFTDYSVLTRNIRVVSGNAKTATAQFKYYDSSGSFDGTNSYIYFDGETNYNWMNFGTGDFTVSFWVYLNTTSQPTYASILASAIATYNAGAVALMLGSNRLIRLVGSGKTERAATTALGASQWYHVAVARSGTSLKIFLDGVQDVSLTDSQSWSFDFAGTYIGRNAWDGANGYANVYIQDLQLVKGAALWTSAFTPPGKLTGTISNSGSGVDAILDDTSSAAIRRVKVVPRAVDLAKAYTATSDASGRFSIQAPNLSCNVLFEDDDAGTSFSDILVSKVTPG